MEGKKILFIFLLALGLFSVTARGESDDDVDTQRMVWRAKCQEGI